MGLGGGDEGGGGGGGGGSGGGGGGGGGGCGGGGEGDGGDGGSGGLQWLALRVMVFVPGMLTSVPPALRSTYRITCACAGLVNGDSTTAPQSGSCRQRCPASVMPTDPLKPSMRWPVYVKLA